jgi:colanic acid biosynthesis glycosyl transferase WcaI
LPESGWATKFFRRIEDSCRRQCDGIIALGKCMRNRLVARGIPADKVHVAENWADGNAILAEPQRRSGPVRILYSGNLGLAHDVETIAAAMEHFRDDPRFVFTFSGSGVGRDQLRRICLDRGLQNAQFLPYASRDQMSAHLGQADIGLVTELPAFLGTVVPSKVYGLMASGRPILFIGPREATPGFLVRRFACGWTIAPGDSSALIELLESLYADRSEIRTRGRRARSAFERHYDLPRGVERVAAFLGLTLARQPAVAAASRPDSLPRRSRPGIVST